MARVRIGVLGLTHDHVWGNLDRLVQLERAELVGAAEPDPGLREKFRQRYGDRVTVADYEALLEGRYALQAVFIFADNRTAALLGAEAARRGLHVLVEKPMADTLARAEVLLAAARRAGVVLMVNWPHNWNPKLRLAYRLTRDGVVGEVFKLRYAGGHAGPREIGCSEIFCAWLYDSRRNGIGALTDQGGYAATVCRWFLGRPNRVVALGGRLAKSDIIDLDNVVMLLRYDRALAVAEASWSWVGGFPTAGPVVYGTEGTLVAHGAREAAGVTVVTRAHPEPQVLEAPPLPEGERNAPEYFVDCLLRERPVEGLVSPEVSRDAQEILEAAVLSLRRQTVVALPLDEVLPGVAAPFS